MDDRLRQALKPGDSSRPEMPDWLILRERARKRLQQRRLVAISGSVLIGAIGILGFVSFANTVEPTVRGPLSGGTTSGPTESPSPTTSASESPHDSQDDESCPKLLPGGDNAQEKAIEAGSVYVENNKGTLPWTDYRISAREADGPPMGSCGDEVWSKTWIADVKYEYPPDSPAAQSASLSSATLFLGQTQDGWRVWLQFH